MAINVAINGFGRIGRLVFRHAFQDKKFNFVAVNDLTDTKTLAYLLKYDSVHGRFPGKVSATKTGIKVGGKTLQVLSETDPAKLPWKKLGVDVVIESTGRFRTRELAHKHIEAGARKVMISAPSADADIMIVMGVNHKDFRKSKHHIISTASCTTNCLAPVVKVLNDNFGIKNGLMTQLRRIQPGKTIEQAHMRGRALVAYWIYEKGKPENVISMEIKDGKKYVVINDYVKLRKLFGELLKEIQRITSEGDYEAARDLVETYGVQIDQELHKEMLDRYSKLNLAPYGGFMNPVYTPVMEDGKIVDVKILYPDDYVKQMLRYGKDYSFLN